MYRKENVLKMIKRQKPKYTKKNRGTKIKSILKTTFASALVATAVVFNIVSKQFDTISSLDEVTTISTNATKELSTGQMVRMLTSTTKPCESSTTTAITTTTNTTKTTTCPSTTLSVPKTYIETPVVVANVTSNEIVTTPQPTTTTSETTTSTTSTTTSTIVEESSVDTTETVEEVFEQSDYVPYPGEYGSETFAGYFEGTYYTAIGCGWYSEPVFGHYRELVPCYSVASNYFASGTILHIVGGCYDGYYRVDDTGGMAMNVIDFYYFDDSQVPYDHYHNGRYYSLEVYVVN